VEKFNPKTICKKCGSDAADSRCRRETFWLQPDGREIPAMACVAMATGSRRIQREWIERTCSRCKYQWREQPLELDPESEVPA
jgi:hypothetical protein